MTRPTRPAPEPGHDDAACSPVRTTQRAAPLRRWSPRRWPSCRCARCSPTGRWLPDVWAAMLLMLGPAALLRMRAPARSIHLLPGPAHHDLLPDRALRPRPCVGRAASAARHLVGHLDADISSFGDTIRDSVGARCTRPRRSGSCSPSNCAARRRHRPARRRRPGAPHSPGVPFLLLFTVAGAVPRHAVGWLWFALAAVGYLLLLGSDARDDLSRWGRLMPRNVGGSRAAVKALSARRIGVIAIIIAVAVPLLLPVRSSNVLADALHGGTGGSGKGGVSLSPFASLKGQLNRKNPETLFKVTARTDSARTSRSTCARSFSTSTTPSGWRQGDNGTPQPLDSTRFAAEPSSDRPNFVTLLRDDHDRQSRRQRGTDLPVADQHRRPVEQVGMEPAERGRS